MVEGLRNIWYEDKLKVVGLTTLEDRRKGGDMIQVFNMLKGNRNGKVNLHV